MLALAGVRHKRLLALQINIILIGVKSITYSIKTLADYYNVKYNDTERYALLKNYVSSVDTVMLSPLTSFDKYEKYYSRVQNELIGLTTASGIKINHKANISLSVFLVLKMTLHITINQEVEYLYLISKML